MKTLKYSVTPLIRVAILISLIVSSSCSTVFFDKPQPTDAGNMNHVPKAIQGKWMKSGKNYEETLTIDRNSYHKIAVGKRGIPKSKIDGSKSYRMASGKIYTAEQDFKTGYPYELLNDTIFFSERNEEEIVLSDSVLLRSAKNCYILNLKRGNWWEIVFIQKMKNGEIRISYPVSEELLDMKKEFNIVLLDSTRKDSTYFHADFKSRNIDGIIPENDNWILYILKPDSTFEAPE
jgi:hypothetical protein